MAIKVLTLELTEEIRPVWGIEGYKELHILVRYQGQLVGWAYITNLHQPFVSVEQLRQTIAQQLGSALIPVVLEHQFKPVSTDDSRPMPISVVVCTRDRINQLERCLEALLALDYPDYEIIVVDNAPSNEDTAQFVDHLPVRYVREERPGLAWARNRGLVEASHDVIAFIGDDTYPNRGWLRAIASALAEPEVMAVTGFVAPAELETRTQTHFAQIYNELNQPLRRRVTNRNALTNWGLPIPDNPLAGASAGRKGQRDRKWIWRRGLTDRELLWANAVGMGTNMAFRRDLFAAIGSFDTTFNFDEFSSGGAQEIFHRLVARGYTLVYEPAALVWRTYPRDAASLRRFIYNRGRSFGAYLLTCARNRTVGHFSIWRFAVGEWLGWWLLRRLLKPGKIPRRLVAIELVGALLSPLAYEVAQVRARRLAAAPAVRTVADPASP